MSGVNSDLNPFRLRFDNNGFLEGDVRDLKISGLRAGCELNCPGCSHRMMSAEESLAQKTHWLQRKLAPWRGALSPIRSVDAENRWNYRHKVTLSTAWNNDGWAFGFIVREELLPIPECPVHSARVRESIRLFSQALPPGPEFPMAYYVQSGAQATLVLKTARLPDTDWLDRDFQRRLAKTGIEGLWLHLHPSAGRRLFTKRGWRLVWGRPRSMDRNGLVYGPSAFQQLIPALYDHALDKARAFIAPGDNDSVVDLYCGIGNTLAPWRDPGARTVGVEMGGEAVECARENAPGALVLRGKCAQRIPQLRAWIGDQGNGPGQRLLYVNPPRTGIEPEVLNWVVGELRPVRIAYLSCSAGTLRGDLEILGNANYRVEEIAPYDFFPQTYHVETLALLKRSDNGGTITPAEGNGAR